MIPLEIFDYSEHREIDIEVTKYVNENLASIVLVVLDLLNDNCGFDMEGFLPRDYLERKPEECRRLVDELYEMIASDVLRDHYIKPKYEYLLYSILAWWEDSTDQELDLIPNPLENELYKKVENEQLYKTEDDYNFVLEKITSYDSYYYICFENYDFLPDQLSTMVSLYLQNPTSLKKMFSIVDLDDYEDLMPCDLRELYRENKRNNQVPDSIDIEQGVITEIISSLQSLEQRVVEIVRRDETEISNDIYSSLNRVLKYKFGLEITREMTMGRAISKLGETDLYIYKNDAACRTDYAIVENKYIETFTSQYRQLLGYLNPNFKFGITISINKKLRLADAVTKIKDILFKIKEDDMQFKITTILTPFDEFPYVIKSSHIIPEDPTKEMSIYHLILNLFDYERKEIAKVARKSANKL